MARRLIERLTDAVSDLREPLPTKMLGDIHTERKSAPDYGQPVYNDFVNWKFQSWGWNKGYPAQDFNAEVGPLDKSSLVMAVVNDTGTALAEAMPSVRFRNNKNKWEPVPDHDCALLVQRPNPFNVWADYCGALSLSWWIDGNDYFYKSRNKLTGEIKELWYLPHYMVEERWPGDRRNPEVPTSGPNKAENDYLSHYQYSIPGREPVLIPQKDVLHIKRFVNPSNPRTGIGAFDSVITDIYGDGAAARFSATILKNMGITVPLFMPKDDSYSPTETEARAFKAKWKQETTGANAGNAMVMTVPLKPEKYTFTPQEMDLASLRRIPESRIAAVTRYPAAYLQFLVGLENGTSYASYEQAREQAYEQVIMPIQHVIATNFTWQLLNEFDGAKGAQFYFDVSEVRVLQEDRNELFKREVAALSAGGQTVNQFLAALGRDTIPNGDIFLIPSMSTPMTPERLRAAAEKDEPPPVVPPIDPASLAKFADMERWIDSLEEQMKGFVNDQQRT
jgi:HK97 family phage portal protein